MSNPADEADPTVTEKIERIRPLNATQTRNVQRLVSLSYEEVKNRVVMLSKRDLEQKKDEIYGQDRLGEAQDLADEARDLVRDYMDKMSALQAKCRMAGFRSDFPGIAEAKIKVTDDNIKRQVNLAEAQNARDRELALAQIDEMESQVQRRVLLASITGEAQALVNDLPDADAILASLPTVEDTRRIIRAIDVHGREHVMPLSQARELGWRVQEEE